MRYPHLATGLACTVATAALVTAYEVGRARADGIPTMTPLTYSGTLLNRGTPVSGSVDLTFSLLDAPTGGTVRCMTSAPGTPVMTGRFGVALDPGCVDAVHAYPDLWMQVAVNTDGGVTTFPATHLGAVPYAVEAARAQAASTTGPLATQLQALQSQSTRTYYAEGNHVDFLGVGSWYDVPGASLSINDGSTTFQMWAVGNINAGNGSAGNVLRCAVRFTVDSLPVGLVGTGDYRSIEATVAPIVGGALAPATLTPFATTERVTVSASSSHEVHVQAAVVAATDPTIGCYLGNVRLLVYGSN